MIVLLSVNSQGNQQDDLKKVVIVVQEQQQQNSMVARSNAVLARAVCGVVVDVHDAALSSVRTKRDQLAQTRDYLRTLKPDEVNSSLTQRIRQNLPNVVGEVQDALDYEAATRVPAACDKVVTP